jgi:hypothetical protein
MSNVYKILVRQPEGKRPLRRPSCRWVNNIKKDLGDAGLGWKGLDYLAQDKDQ